MAGAVGELEKEREDGLGDVRRAVLRDVANRNPAGLRSGAVDDVVAGGKDTDQLELRQRRDRLGGDHGLVREEDLGGSSPNDDVARGRPKAVAAFKGLNYRVIAAGDSFNDTTMLAEADAGFLFHAPPNVIAQFPQFQAVDEFDDLLHLIMSAAQSK